MPPQNSYLQIILLLLCSPIITSSSTDGSSDILFDVTPFIILYKNGTAVRLLGVGNTVPASPHHPTAGVRSKDVTIDAHHNISARLYMPATARPARKLPLLVYFHGGAFVTESAFSKTYHNYISTVVAKAKAVGVSVNYRLAPENPLPIAYEDSWLALEWVFSYAPDPWLKNYVDFKKVYVGGDSAGGNIAHNLAMRAGLERTGPVKIYGIFLNCPHFGGNKLIGKEKRQGKEVGKMENIWRVANYPNNVSFDDPALNPSMDPNLRRLGCERVLVYVAQNDVLRDRGVVYARDLNKSGWNGVVKVVDARGVGHVFNLNDPNTSQARRMMRHVTSFIHPGILPS